MNIINKIYKDEEFMNFASPVLYDNEFLKTKQIVHHGSTRYSHCVKVSYLSYKVSKILGADKNSVVKAGMLHDFFLQRDDKNIKTEAKMFVNHPKIAKENAIKFFNVNEKEQNIIESHMFPFSYVKPKYKESWIVSICDKFVALFEGVSSAKAQLSLWLILLVNYLK